MPLIIDTYNVLHVTGVLPGELAVGSPEELAKLVASSRYAREAVWLMCDGVPRGATRVGRIVIEGSGPGRTADEHIAEFLRRSSAPGRVTVVSSDRAVGRGARARGADWIKSEEFLARLAEDAGRKRTQRATGPDPRRSVPLSDREVAGWMSLFEISAEMAEIAATPKRDRAAEAPRVHSASTEQALERYLEATKDLADPLSILDGREGIKLLDALGEIDDASLDELMRRHEPSVEKDGARVGGKRRTRRKPK